MTSIRRGMKAVVAAVACSALLVVVAPPASAAANLSINASGTSGTGTKANRGLGCGESGGYDWNYTYTATLPPGQFGAVVTSLSMTLDAHAQVLTTSPDPTTVAPAYLGPNAAVTLSNARGSVKLTLASGSCNNPTLSTGGSTNSLSGSGTWTLGSGTGSYREATGNGTFTLTATTAGATNQPFTLALSGVVNVLQPNLAVTPATQARWATVSDFLARRLTVTYQVRNTGSGDAFGVALTNVMPTTAGVSVIGGQSTPRPIGKLSANETKTVSVLYQLATSNPPCALLVVSCTVDAQLTFAVPDSLDVPIAPAPVIETSITKLI